MSGPKRVLAAFAMVVAAGTAATAGYSMTAGLSRSALGALGGAEIVAMAVLVLPWFTVYAWRAARRFAPGEAAATAWNALAAASVLLLLGQIAAYLPPALDLGGLEAPLVVAGQLLPAAFRVVLCWALWRVRRAYCETGIDFHLTPADYVASAAVTAAAAFLLTRTDVLFAYWTANADFAETARPAMLTAQVVNFLLYPAVFYSSLAMSRYAMQMGGGLVARAWCCVALYGLLQTLHAFAIAALLPRYGPLVAVTFDNFIVLGAFVALAFGPIYQVEATEVDRA